MTDARRYSSSYPPDPHDPVIPPSAERLNTKRAAAELGVPEGTLRNWRTEGKGPRYFKLGGRVFYLRRDLAAYFWQSSCHEK